MAHEQKLHLKIVATLGDSFSKIFTSTNKKMDALAKTSQDLNAKMSRLNGMRELQKKTLESGLAFQKHQRELVEFKKNLASSSEVTKKQKRDLDRLTTSVKKSSTVYEAQSSKLRQFRNELRGAGLDVKNLERAESQLKQSLEQTNKKISAQKNIHHFARYGQALKHRAKQARSDAFGAVVGVGATAAASMYEPLHYTHEMNKVHILGRDSDGSEYNPQILDDMTKNISKEYGISLTETAKTAASYLLGGLKPKETEALMKPTFDLAVASDTSVEEVGVLMKALKSSFKMSADPKKSDMKYLSNAIAKASNASDLSVSDLAESSKYLLDLPHNFGMKLHEMLGILSVSGDAQFKGSEAGTATVQMLERLSQPKIQEKLRDRMGVKVTQRDKDGKTEFRNIFDVVKDIEKSLKNKGNAEREALLVEIFETQAGRAMRNVLGDIPKLERNSKSFSKESVDPQYAENLRVQMQKSSLANLKQVYWSFATLNTQIFDTYEDKISKISVKIKEVTELTSSFIKENKDVISSLVKTSGAIVGIGLAWKVTKALTLTALAPLFDVGKALFFIGRAHPVIAIISGIATASYLLWKYWDDIVQTMKKAGTLFANVKNTFFPSPVTTEVKAVPKPDIKPHVVNDNKQLKVEMHIKSENPKEAAIEAKKQLQVWWRKEFTGPQPLFDMASL